MKKNISIFLCILVLLIIVMPLVSCTDKISGKIAFATDMHIVANSLINDDNYNDISDKDKMIHITDAITNTMIDDIIKKRIKVLLIGGDIVENGDEESHLKAAESFRRLEKKGVKVLVINGNHDVAPNTKGKQINSERFAEIYAEFGYNEALERYLTKNEGTLSYTAEIDKRSRLIAIDNIVHTEVDEKTGALGEYNKPESLSNKHIEWVIEQVNKCLEDGKKPVVMTHISLINHFPRLAHLFFNSAEQEQYNKLLELLADNNAKYVLAGHYHFQDNAEYTSKGNTLYEVETSSLSFFPCSYRQIDITKKEIKTFTRYIEKVDKKYLPQAMPAEDQKTVTESFREYCKDRYHLQLQKIIKNAISPDGGIGSKLDEIDNINAQKVVKDLFSIATTLVNNPFFIADEKENQVSLERILNTYDINISKIPEKNLLQLLPSLGEKLFIGNEDLRESEEIKILNYSILSMFYFLNEKSQAISDAYPEYVRLNINMKDLFVDGRLECYDSNFVPFALQIINDIDTGVASLVQGFIEDDLTSYKTMLSPIVSIATKGIIIGKDLEPYFGKKYIDIGPMLSDALWGIYGSTYILDGEPDDVSFTFKWEVKK